MTPEHLAWEPADAAQALSTCLSSDAPQGIVTFQESGAEALSLNAGKTAWPFFLLPLEGSLRVRIASGGGARVVELRSGIMAAFCPGTWVDAGMEDLRCMLRITLEQHQIVLGMRESPQAPAGPARVPMISLPAPSPWLLGLSDRILRLDADPALGRVLLWELRELLSRGSTPETSRAQRTWLTLRAYVEEHAHMPLDRTTVAEAFGIHPAYVSRIYKQFGRQGFHEHLKSCRMRRARQLLAESDRTIAEIGEACGYPDLAYFTRAFREIHGSPPGQWRRTPDQAST